MEGSSQDLISSTVLPFPNGGTEDNNETVRLLYVVAKLTICIY